MRNIKLKIKRLHINKRGWLLHRYSVLWYRYIPEGYVYAVSTNNGVTS
jgi:hypothetical protein